MKHPIIRRGAALLALSLAATTIAAGGVPSLPPATPPPPPPVPETLFPANEFGFSIFGEYDTGDIHLSSQPATVTQSKTVHYTVPGGSGGGIISVFTRPPLRFASSSKPAPPGTDPSVTVTRRRHIQVTHVEHDAGGGGVQLSYYFCRYFGMAIEGDFLGGSTYLTQLSGQFIVRYPFEFFPKPVSGYSKDAKDVRSDSKDYKGGPATSGPTWGIAPYAIFGGGGQWDGRLVGLADVGGGIEIRFRQQWGIFSDARWYVRDSSQHFTAIRVGVSYNF